jgi:hypothetical protein
MKPNPVPARRVSKVLRDCKITPAYGACQGRNTTGCILNNDGLGAGEADSFSTREIHRGFTEGEQLPVPGCQLPVRARKTVRAKSRWVNSVFLVQLRKTLATDLHGWARIKNIFRVWLQAARRAWVRFAAECLERNLESPIGGLFTAGAQEMQKGSGQWLVVSGQLNGLAARFAGNDNRERKDNGSGGLPRSLFHYLCGLLLFYLPVRPLGTPTPVQKSQPGKAP